MMRSQHTVNPSFLRAAATVLLCGGLACDAAPAATPSQPPVAEAAATPPAQETRPAPGPENLQAAPETAAHPGHPSGPGPGEEKPLTEEQAEWDRQIKKEFGATCRYERTCGDIIGADCNAAADGPYYYLDKKTLKKLATCGGACMSGNCTNCPPEGWSCATY